MKNYYLVDSTNQGVSLAVLPEGTSIPILECHSKSQEAIHFLFHAKLWKDESEKSLKRNTSPYLTFYYNDVSTELVNLANMYSNFFNITYTKSDIIFQMKKVINMMCELQQLLIKY